MESFEWLDYDKATPINEACVTSLICDPPAGQRIDVEDGSVTARGYAWSGGGRGIIRVELSADDGATWHEADLTHTTPSIEESHSRSINKRSWRPYAIPS